MKLTEKQKNCPFCHYPWEKIPIDNLEDDDEAFYFERYETNGPHKLMKTINVLRNDDILPWLIAIKRVNGTSRMIATIKKIGLAEGKYKPIEVDIEYLERA